MIIPIYDNQLKLSVQEARIWSGLLLWMENSSAARFFELKNQELWIRILQAPKVSLRFKFFISLVALY